MQNCRTKLRRVTKAFDIPLAQFMLCEPKVNLVKRPEELTYGQVAKMEVQQIRQRAHEEEEEDIKIFRGEDEEPISLMDIEESLVVKYADYAFQMFRLYVVYEGHDTEDVITRLRTEVKDWDKG